MGPQFNAMAGSIMGIFKSHHIDINSIQKYCL